MKADRLMFIAGEHIMSDWLCDETQSEMAVSALMTGYGLASQTMNFGYVREHIYTTPLSQFPAELGPLFIELSSPLKCLGDICSH